MIMGNAVFVSLCLSGVLFALVLSVISLVKHWIARDESPEIASLNTRILEVQNQILDLTDKVQHWRNRDNVRNARAGAEKKLETVAEPQTVAEKKAQLRAKATAAGFGMTG